jgi:hypothetical protein
VTRCQNQQKNSQKACFKSFHELIALRVNEILLISSPYDAFIMQEDGHLSERIIHEYQGLNLSRPPRLSWVSNAAEALTDLKSISYDLVIVMPHISDMDSYALCRKIKSLYPDLPVYYFAYDAGKVLEEEQCYNRKIIDRTFVWGGNTDLLLALVKNQEDSMNVDTDTQLANVRVMIFVEDSPFYLSTLLPYLYKEIVMQTQAVMDDSLNEKERILRMRTRPKILVAENYEQAWLLYEKYKEYLMCVISDVRYEKQGKDDAEAGIKLLMAINKEIPDIPLLMLSSEPGNRERADAIPAFFLDKNSPSLHADIRYFFVHYLGFGDFLFRMPDGRVVARASNLRSLSTILHSVPDESIDYHASRNHFSRWLMARFEMQLAASLRPLKVTDFPSTRSLKEMLTDAIRDRLKIKQKGLISDFVSKKYDPDIDFVKIGKGSLGGKARGLAFISSLFRENSELQSLFPAGNIVLPRIVVITTDGFDAFEQENDIRKFRKEIHTDLEIETYFKKAGFPQWLANDLRTFLRHTEGPLAVRSSAILEDAHYRPSAGAYNTYMLPNNHPKIQVRLEQLMQAIKLVYSSLYKEAPRVLARHSIYRPEEDKMAVIIQKLVGCQHGDYFYPAISGVAQSYNFYPVDYMKPEEGVAHIALGLGKIVVDGGVAMRFSPKYPELLPQFSTVDNILKNAQRYFYALKMRTESKSYVTHPGMELEKIDVDDAVDHAPVKRLSSTYFPEDGRIRDVFNKKGYPVVTFASILKFKEFPLGEILSELLEVGRNGMGCPVEMEFAVNFYNQEKPEFCLLQIRPMMVARNTLNVKITPEELKRAFCYSDKAMGSSQETPVTDIIYIKPHAFDTAKTIEIAEEIGQMNQLLKQKGQKYLLIGPGRWGTTDRWLGIPVKWSQITQVGTIIETTSEKLSADPSQGSHFFHNITSLGINYFGVSQKDKNVIDWHWLDGQTVVKESVFLRYIALEEPALIKINGKDSIAVILKPGRAQISSDVPVPVRPAAGGSAVGLFK